ncbi:MAG: hypothetical protein SGI74_05655 [Oligoflexia bacterium]|nr:hypothetical protein [Oligoflexia bacterium]
MLTYINWWHWWLPQFFISGLIWIVFAPSIGSIFLKLFRAKKNTFELSDKSQESLNFILGFIIISYFLSFLVALHNFALPVLMLLLSALTSVNFTKEKQFKILKITIYDFIFILPIFFSALLSPVSIDSPLGALQFSFFHDQWPLDWGKDFDTHMALPMLLGSWFKKIPLTQNLAVQAPYFALLIWRSAYLAWELARHHWPFKISAKNKTFLLTLMMSTVYYRKIIHVKASPIGGLFAILFCFWITHPAAKNNKAITGVLLASTFIFGDYGALITLPLLVVLLISKHHSTSIFNPALLWALAIVSPDILRKTYIFSNGNVFILALTTLLLGLLFFIVKIFIDCYCRYQNSFKNTELFFFAIMLFTAILTNILFTPVSMSESAQFNLYQWSIGREGILLIFLLFFMYKFKTHDSSKILFAILGVQLLMYSLFRFIDGTPHFGWPNPNDLWWNLMKNSMMITTPLVISITMAMIISYWLDHFDNNKFKNKTVVAFVFAALLLLQDPLVKNVRDGSLAPHAPRLPVVTGVAGIIWQAIHKKAVSSESGNIVLNYLALPEPNLIENIFEIQKNSTTRINICIERELNPVGIADFDIETYTIDNPTGAHGYIRAPTQCSHFIRAHKKSNCLNSELLIFDSKSALLCQVAN